MSPRVVLAALLLAGCMQQMPKPAGPPPPERARSIAFGADADKLARARVRADARRGGAAKANPYHVAKAHAWLDLASGEGRNEASGDTAEDALDQAESLIGVLERGRTPSLRTLHLVGSRPVRDDLWAVVDEMKNSAAFPCVGEPLARAEVALVWAGHKTFIGDQKGAEDIGARAEQFLDAARNEVVRCIAVTEPAEKPPVAPAVPTPAPAPGPGAGIVAAGEPASAHIEVVRLRTDALFRFGAARLDRGGSGSLRELVQRIRSIPDVVSVRIHGHTDRLSRGSPSFNHGLAASRARAVGKALVAQGVNAALIETHSHGDTMPVVDCPGPRSKVTIDCLAANRRVEIEIERAR